MARPPSAAQHIRPTIACKLLCEVAGRWGDGSMYEACTADTATARPVTIHVRPGGQVRATRAALRGQRGSLESPRGVHGGRGESCISKPSLSLAPLAMQPARNSFYEAGLFMWLLSTSRVAYSGQAAASRRIA